METVYMVCYEETDSYDYECVDKTRTFQKKDECLDFVSGMFLPLSDSRLDIIFEINKSKKTIQELEVALENKRLVFKEKVVE